MNDAVDLCGELEPLSQCAGALCAPQQDRDTVIVAWSDATHTHIKPIVMKIHTHTEQTNLTTHTHIQQTYCNTHTDPHTHRLLHTQTYCNTQTALPAESRNLLYSLFSELLKSPLIQ